LYHPPSSVLIVADLPQSPEFNDCSQASIFALPKFNPEKEMKMLQNLWTKRCSSGEDPPPLICRSTRPSEDISDVADPSPERSFFESDSDTEDEEAYSKRYISSLLTTN
jgi:hypothetical protein